MTTKSEIHYMHFNTRNTLLKYMWIFWGGVVWVFLFVLIRIV